VDKVAEYRAFARMRRALPQSYTSLEMHNFSRFLIKVSLAVGLSQLIGILMSFSAGIACALCRACHAAFLPIQSASTPVPWTISLVKSLQNTLN
jgi:hypothetical protein